MISSSSTSRVQSSNGLNTNYVMICHLAAATVLAATMSNTPSADKHELPQKNLASANSCKAFLSEKTSPSNNILIIWPSAACNLVESVHTPISSAGMLEGGIMHRALLKLEGLKQLADGWAGYESRRPDLRSVEEAQVFAHKILSRPSILEPIISPATDGEVNFFWENPHITLDLGFYGDGSYSFYAKTEDGEEFFGDHYSIEIELPQKIYEHLQKT